MRGTFWSGETLVRPEGEREGERKRGREKEERERERGRRKRGEGEREKEGGREGEGREGEGDIYEGNDFPAGVHCILTTKVRGHHVCSEVSSFGSDCPIPPPPPEPPSLCLSHCQSPLVKPSSAVCVSTRVQGLR